MNNEATKQYMYPYEIIKVIFNTLTTTKILELQTSPDAQSIYAVGEARDLLDIDTILSNINNKLVAEYGVYLEYQRSGVYKIKENA